MLLEQPLQGSQSTVTKLSHPSLMYLFMKLTPHNDIKGFLHTLKRKAKWSGIPILLVSGEVQRAYFTLSKEDAENPCKFPPRLYSTLHKEQAPVPPPWLGCLQNELMPSEPMALEAERAAVRGFITSQQCTEEPAPPPTCWVKMNGAALPEADRHR